MKDRLVVWLIKEIDHLSHFEVYFSALLAPTPNHKDLRGWMTSSFEVNIPLLSTYQCFHLHCPNRCVISEKNSVIVIVSFVIKWEDNRSSPHELAGNATSIGIFSSSDFVDTHHKVQKGLYCFSFSLGVDLTQLFIGAWHNTNEVLLFLQYFPSKGNTGHFSRRRDKEQSYSFASKSVFSSNWEQLEISDYLMEGLGEIVMRQNIKIIFEWEINNFHLLSQLQCYPSFVKFRTRFTRNIRMLLFCIGSKFQLDEKYLWEQCTVITARTS